MSKYIKIKQSETNAAWYANKIGMVFKTDKNVEFDHCYTIKLTKKKSRANWGTVSLTDAVIVRPNFFRRLLIAIGIH